MRRRETERTTTRKGQNQERERKFLRQEKAKAIVDALLPCRGFFAHFNGNRREALGNPPPIAIPKCFPTGKLLKRARPEGG